MYPTKEEISRKCQDPNVFLKNAPLFDKRVRRIEVNQTAVT